MCLKKLSVLKTNFEKADGLGIRYTQISQLMPSPSAISKMFLGTLKYFKHTQFLKYTQNVLSTLKRSNLYSKISLLSISKTF